MRTERLIMTAAAAAILLLAAGCGVDDDAPVLGDADQPPPTVTITGVQVGGTTGMATNLDPSSGPGVVTLTPLTPAAGENFTIEFVRPSPYSTPQTQGATLPNTATAADLLKVDVTYK